MTPNLLESVPEPERTRVLDACRTRTFRRNEVLFHEGDPGLSLYIIESGHLVVRTSTDAGDVVTLDVAGPGDVIGEMALVRASNVRSATVAAIDDCTTWVLTRESFDALLREHPGVQTAVTALVAERVDKLTHKLSEALFLPVDRRVARRIWQVAALWGGAERGTRLPLTQNDVADLVGATRPTVNQSLKKLEARGAIELYRGGVRIADVDELRVRAGLARPDAGLRRPG